MSSFVATPISDTNEATLPVALLISLITLAILLVETTPEATAVCVSLINFSISLEAMAECSASFLTSSATTAKPLPCSDFKIRKPVHKNPN
jgi:hypothetical protein